MEWGFFIALIFRFWNTATMHRFYRAIMFFLLLPATLPASAQESETTSKTFHSNGRLKEITHQGHFNGCGIAVGTDSFFSSAGKLLHTRSYNHFSTGPGCHSTLTVTEEKTYFPNGKLKTVSRERIYYEGEAEKCGVWKWYNTAGKVVRKKNWGKCLL